MNELVTGGIREVTLGEGMVSMTLMRKEVRPEGESPVVHELLLSPGGFLQFYSQLEQMVGKLIEDGVIRKEEGDA